MTVSEIKAIEVTAVEGHMLNDSHTHVLVGLMTGDASKIALAATEANLVQIISGFVGALSAFAKPKLSKAERPSIRAEWFEAGVVKDTQDIALTLRMRNGGALNFILPRALAKQLQETLAVGLGQTDLLQPPGTVKQ